MIIIFFSLILKKIYKKIHALLRGKKFCDSFCLSIITLIYLLQLDFIKFWNLIFFFFNKMKYV